MCHGCFFGGNSYQKGWVSYMLIDGSTMVLYYTSLILFNHVSVYIYIYIYTCLIHVRQTDDVLPYSTNLNDLCSHNTILPCCVSQVGGIDVTNMKLPHILGSLCPYVAIPRSGNS